MSLKTIIAGPATVSTGSRPRGLLSRVLPVVALALLVAGRAGGHEFGKAIFLVMEEDSVVASNAQTGQFFELELKAKEEVLERIAGDGVAVVVTNQRFAGIGAFSGGWRSLRRMAGEEFRSVEAQDYAALVVTSNRIISFSGRNGSWSHTTR
ncbi:MAG: hypothetical protein OEN52_02630 [Gammaproteobacteria bacterium]|nr:hypothetical protein [Gammaproteobacteria bacterium]MDH3559834.1 hypothetical protein [Gammaproteobacteria bacterium]